MTLSNTFSCRKFLYIDSNFTDNVLPRIQLLVLIMAWCWTGNKPLFEALTHWGRVTHICVGKRTIIGSDNGLSPGRRQAIIWTSAGILLIGPLGTNFSEISIKILAISFTKIRLQVSSAKWRPFCLGFNVLRTYIYASLGLDDIGIIAVPIPIVKWKYFQCSIKSFFL